MNPPAALQLAALELRLAELVHPDWLREPLRDTVFAADAAPAGWRVACSRWLIERHALPPLEPAAFGRSWQLAVVGGHDAVRALQEQTASYLAASWLRRTVDGRQRRELQRCFGAQACRALMDVAPLACWRAPPGTAEALPWLRTLTRRCLQALWDAGQPTLAAWARLMMSLERCDLALDEADEPGPAAEPSAALLAEIEERLHADFAAAGQEEAA